MDKCYCYIELEVEEEEVIDLEVEGEFYPYSDNIYDGDYVITPLADSEVVLPTSGKMMADDVTVHKVPFYETTNESGTTVYIASEG